VKQETLTITAHWSKYTTLGQLVVSAPQVGNSSVDLVVGRIGFPSVERTLHVGGTVLYETPDDGLIELRVVRIQFGVVGSLLGNQFVNEATVLVSQVSPHGGLVAGFTTEDASNAPFEPQELDRLRHSLEQARQTVAQSANLTSAQLDFVTRKLEEMAHAASRLGRKDWLNLAVGTLTNVVVTAALSSDAARCLFQAVSSALSWLSAGTLKLLP